MPKSSSSQKAARVSEKRRLRNRSTKSAIKTSLLKAEKLIQQNDIESAQIAVADTASAFDKAAKRRVIHPNTASRHKSRLTRKLNHALNSSTAESKPTDS